MLAVQPQPIFGIYLFLRWNLAMLVNTLHHRCSLTIISIVQMTTIVTRSPRMYTHKRLYFPPGCDPILLHTPSMLHRVQSNVLPSLMPLTSTPSNAQTGITNDRTLTTTPTMHVDVQPKRIPLSTTSTQTVITSSMIHTPEVKSPSYNQHMVKTHKLSPKITVPTSPTKR